MSKWPPSVDRKRWSAAIHHFDIQHSLFDIRHSLYDLSPERLNLLGSSTRSGGFRSKSNEGPRGQVKYLIAMVMRLLAVWALGIILLAVPFSHAEGIEGHWLADNPSGNSVIFNFGPEYAFYMEDGASWVQGTYTIRPDTMPKQLDLYIEKGSDVEDVGKEVHYHYNVDVNLLTLSATGHPTALDVANPSDRYVFIGYNLDSSDDDDDDDSNFSIYASCFVAELTGQ